MAHETGHFATPVRCGTPMRRLERLRKLWHPHQKLWNSWVIWLIRGRFGTGAAGESLLAGVIIIDSLLLAARSRSRGAFGRMPPPLGRPRVLYIDCGLHRQAEEVRWMHRWFGERYELHVFGFEASGEHAVAAAAELAGLEHLHLHQLALVGPDYEGEEARLYKASGRGRADSLFSERGQEFEVVPAARLSAVLAREGWDIRRTPTILRMNIEGAEQFVIADLLEAGLADSVDGYYGLWDDLYKIDRAADQHFRLLLAEHGISPLTFNDRDLEVRAPAARLSPRQMPSALRALAFRLRQSVIRRDIESAIAAGLARSAANERDAAR